MENNNPTATAESRTNYDKQSLQFFKMRQEWVAANKLQEQNFKEALENLLAKLNEPSISIVY